MNLKDLERLERLRRIIGAVPFPAAGTATRTVRGLIGYEADMRALQPTLLMLLTSMRLEDISRNPLLSLVKGEDFYDPDVILEQIELWIEERKAVGWQDASEYSIDPYLDRIRELGGE